MADTLQNKVKTYKVQAEDAEENASINMGRYRKIQHEVDEAQERADLAESNLNNLRLQTKHAKWTHSTFYLYFSCTLNNKIMKDFYK